MKLIVGLGNPGTKYTLSRHNVGFMVLDEVARLRSLRFRKLFSHNAKVSTLIMGKQRVVLAKPQGYMNNSGRCVVKLLARYRLKPEELLIVYDDVDLKLGSIRYRYKGRSAGHKGVASIIDTVKTERIARVRVGIGRPKRSHQDTADYVLSEFLPAEHPPLKKVLLKAARLCLDWLDTPEAALMQKYNS